jgi:hypothetical protein
MKKQHVYERVILAIELIAFGLVIAVTWLDEYVDVPFRFFGAVKTPIRPQEFWFEATTALFVGTAVVLATLWVFRRLRFFEDFIRVCAWCRKVEVDEEWVAFEDYMKHQHDVRSTHGICPTCRAHASKRKATARATPSV